MKTLHVQELGDFLKGRAERQPWLLDVREAWEVKLAPLVIAGTPTLHVPMHQVLAHLAEFPTTQPIVCFCHHGMRSAQVVALLMQRGLQDVYNLDGGIAAWSTLIDADVPQY